MSRFVVEMSGDERKLWQSLQKIANAEDHVSRRARNMGGAGKKAAGMIQNAFSTAAGIAGVGSLSSAISQVIDVARSANEEIKQIAEGLKEANEGAKALWQVSESKKAFKQLSAKYKLAMISEGLDRPTSQALAFDLKSLGKEEAIPTIAQANRFMDPFVAGKYYTTISSKTNWGDQAGTPAQVISGLIAGAGASKFNTGQTAEWMLRAAPSLKSLGATPADILGVGGAISTAAADPSQLGTYVRRLGDILDKWRKSKIAEGVYTEETAPKGLLATYQAMRARDPETYQKVKLDNTRFKVAAQALEGATEEAAKIAENVQRAINTSSLWFEKIGDRPRELTEEQQRLKSQYQAELVREPLARQELALETAINRIKTLAGDDRMAQMKAAGWEKLLGAGSSIGATRAATEQANELILGLLQRQAPDLYKQHLSGMFGLKRGMPIVPGMGAVGGGHEAIGTTPRIPDAPEKLSPEQSAAMGAAMEAWTRRTLIRQGVLPPEKLAQPPGSGAQDARADVQNAQTRDVAARQAEAAEKQAQAAEDLALVASDLREAIGDLKRDKAAPMKLTLSNPDRDR